MKMPHTTFAAVFRRLADATERLAERDAAAANEPVA